MRKKIEGQSKKQKTKRPKYIQGYGQSWTWFAGNLISYGVKLHKVTNEPITNDLKVWKINNKKKPEEPIFVICKGENDISD